MTDRFFLDTSILVYTFDATVPDKRNRARDLVRQGLETGQGVVSFQVIQELLNVATKRFKVPLRTTDCRLYLDRVLTPMLDVFPGVGLYIKGLDLVEHYGFTFYDALIVAAAIESACPLLYSEDLQHGRTVQCTTITNPFI